MYPVDFVTVLYPGPAKEMHERSMPCFYSKMLVHALLTSVYMVSFLPSIALFFWFKQTPSKSKS